jgi:hypothetical protein
VSQRQHDPWRLPTIGQFGEQLRGLEDECRTPTIPRSNVSRRAILLSGGGIVAALACILVLTSGRTARAGSIVNAAPAAAERSRTVRFRSVLTITVNGHPRDGITETGATDFVNGAYTTALRFGHTGQVFERRSVKGVLYATERPMSRARSARIRWFATPLRTGRRVFASETDAFTDPRSVFRALSGIRAPVRRIGHDDVAGIGATRYHLITDLGAFLRPSAGYVQNPAPYRRVRASLDVWLDALGRPLRLEETFTGRSASGPTTMITIIAFSGYESPVYVLAPANSIATSTKGAAPPGPFATGPWALLARRLFFEPPGG